MTIHNDILLADIHAALRQGAISGACASLLSSAALVVCGRRDSGSVFAATNAVSHWIWGDKATRKDRPSMKYTFVGYAIHHVCSTFWAFFFEMYVRKTHCKALAHTAAVATGTSAIAYFVDYNLTPRRLQPGFETRLSGKSLFLVYAAFAVGLAIVARCAVKA